MYPHKNQAKIRALKPINTLYWYSVAVLILLLLFLYSPVQAKFGAFVNTPKTQLQYQTQNIDIDSIGFKMPSALKDSELAMQNFNNGEFSMAFRLWLPLAKQHFVDAQFYIAMLYDMGKGIEKDAENAVYWYRQAALGGNTHAQHNLGVAYADGEGIAKDLSKAVMWWQRSASQGNTDSQYNLGMLYAMGNKTVKRDYDKALKWWHRAANSGDAMAQYNLGSLFANGDGVIKNYCEAVKWWQKSAKNGFNQASMALQLIVEKHDVKACW